MINYINTSNTTTTIQSQVNEDIYKGDLEIKRGDIIWVQYEDTIGSEQSGERPAMVIQNDKGNKHSPTIVVADITSSKTKAKLPVHVELKRNSTSGLSKDSIILFEQLKTIDKRRIIKKEGEVPSNLLDKINKALKISLGIN